MRYLLQSGVLFLALASLTAHADVIGGEDVPPSDPIQKSTVALYSPSADGRSGALCTASLLNKNTALTAAHCIQPGAPAPSVLFGRDIHSSQTAKRQVTGVRINRKWAVRQGRGMDEGDIALVRFQGGLPEGYQAAELSKNPTTLQKGHPVILAGYGISNSRTHGGAGILRKTAVTISNPRPGKSEMILDQSHGHGACHGDSGGPAFVMEGGRRVLAGVTNRSYPSRAPDDCGHQVVYTKVAAYRNWIQKGENELQKAPNSAGYLSAHLKRKPAHHRKERHVLNYPTHPRRSASSGRSKGQRHSRG